MSVTPQTLQWHGRPGGHHMASRSQPAQRADGIFQMSRSMGREQALARRAQSLGRPGDD